MNPMERALWFIESHFASEITLEDIAKAGGVSRFHLTRAFGAATGRSIMRYVRGRRLSVSQPRLCRRAHLIFCRSPWRQDTTLTRLSRVHFAISSV